MGKASNQFLLWMVVIIWLVGLANWLLDYQLNRFGILPRDFRSLYGVLTTPFLHGSFNHLLNNSLAFVTLGWLASLYNENGNNLLLKLTFFVAFWGGLLTWLLARPHFHVGLSGVIFGYWGFVVVNGYFEKSLKAVFISLLAVIFYGGMVFGVLPVSSGVSFESHLFGALSGIVYSYLYRRKRAR